MRYTKTKTIGTVGSRHTRVPYVIIHIHTPWHTKRLHHYRLDDHIHYAAFGIQRD
jgi:hypothetical protein